MVVRPRLLLPASFTLPCSLLALVLLSGCIAQTVHPIYDSRTLIFDERLLGMWSDEDVSLVFEQSGERSYTLVLHDENEPRPLELEAHLARIDGTLFLDLYLDDLPDGTNSQITVFAMPLHTILRVDELDDRLRMSSLSASRLEDLFRDDPDVVEHVLVDGRAVLTAETDVLQRFLAEIADEDDAWEEAGDMRRLEPVGPAGR